MSLLSHWKKPEIILGILGLTLTAFALYLDNRPTKEPVAAPSIDQSTIDKEVYKQLLRTKIEGQETIISENTEKLSRLKISLTHAEADRYLINNTDFSKFQSSKDYEDYDRKKDNSDTLLFNIRKAIAACSTNINEADSKILHFKSELAR